MSSANIAYFTLKTTSFTELKGKENIHNPLLCKVNPDDSPTEGVKL